MSLYLYAYKCCKNCTVRIIIWRSSCDLRLATCLCLKCFRTRYWHWISFQKSLCSCNMCLLIRWCGPCKILGPRIETLVGKQSGDVLLAKVDIDQMQDLAIEYGVSSNGCCLQIYNATVMCAQFTQKLYFHQWNFLKRQWYDF